MNCITINFLKNKLIEAPSGWGYYKSKVDANRSNIKILTKDIVSFDEFNFLPVDGRTLDGHYTFWVKWDTFDYLIAKTSDYGSFTYVKPVEEIQLTKLNKQDTKYVESIIADKLLGAYYHSSYNHHSAGRNLFSNGKQPEYNNKSIWYYDGDKTSRLTDLLVKITNFDKKVITHLIKK